MRFEEMQPILRKLSGRKVTGRYLSGTSIVIGIDKPPNGEESKLLYAEHPWRIENDGIIEATSADVKWTKDDTDESYETKCEAALPKSLKNTTILDCSIDIKTGDLTVRFDNGRVLKSFFIKRWKEVESETAWFLNVFNQRLRYEVAMNGVSTSSLDVQHVIRMEYSPSTGYRPLPPE